MPNKICKINGCTNKVRKQGFCDKHKPSSNLRPYQLIDKAVQNREKSYRWQSVKGNEV